MSWWEWLLIAFGVLILLWAVAVAALVVAAVGPMHARSLGSSRIAWC